jgi:hypothetical protein
VNDQVQSIVIGNTAYRTPDERDKNDYDLLPRRKCAQVNSRKTSTCHLTDTNKEGINVFEAERSIRGSDYASRDHRDKRALIKVDIYLGEVHSQSGNVNSKEIELTPD